MRAIFVHFHTHSFPVQFFKFDPSTHVVYAHKYSSLHVCLYDTFVRSCTLIGSSLWLRYRLSLLSGGFDSRKLSIIFGKYILFEQRFVCVLRFFRIRNQYPTSDLINREPIRPLTSLIQACDTRD